MADVTSGIHSSPIKKQKIENVEMADCSSMILERWVISLGVRIATRPRFYASETFCSSADGGLMFRAVQIMGAFFRWLLLAAIQARYPDSRSVSPSSRSGDVTG